ncbi:CaiB/BaiF CoA-transferase family protein [Acidisphaera sp. S103]|uniref:CaiB/BaiF CoA transferase family protein n=1 Tax=Acidisphaera sp. S103 TaxID=1747223 RepID=UPI00131B233C|nr:CoA transferase [Acidisphaera sp. S103]
MAGPLEGIRVIDLTTVVSGPVCTAILADQGADVIKIEPPTGDIARRTAGDGQFTAMFIACNRGKRSVSLDLKQPAALEALRRLIATADVLVQNFRPGTMERLGLGEPEMRGANPGLVYVSISGVGDTGPYVKKRVYDPIIQSLSGFADVQADQETGRPKMIRTIVADKTTAVYGAQAICAALVARARTGQGQHIRLSMLDTMVGFLWPEAMSQYAIVGRENAPQPAPRPDLIFQTLDGYITVGSLSDSEWRGLCHVIERPEWVDDPRFRTPSARSMNAAERLRLVGEILATGHSEDWLDRLDAAEVPCAPVLRRADVMHNVQVINNALIEEIEQPTVGRVRQARPAARFDRTPARIAGPAPSIGEHTETVLAQIGYSIADIAALTSKPPGSNHRG